MAWRSMIHLALSLAYLSAILGVGGWIYSRIHRFEGEIFIVKGKAERTVVRPAQGGWTPTTLEHDFPAEIIPFDNPTAFRRFLGDKDIYDAVRMTRALRLDAVEVLEERPPRDTLECWEGRESRTLEAKPGAGLTVSGRALAVREIRPWAGLLRNAKGRPMAAVSMRRPGEAWTEHIFLDAGSWRFIEPDIALCLNWFRTEAEARAVLPANLDGLPGARWGVVEGKKVHWFQTFAPGTGVVLDDGTEAVLARHDPAHPSEQGDRPAILVHLKRSVGTESLWYFVNQHAPNAKVRYEDPARAATVYILNGWREKAVVGAAFQQRQACGQTLLEERGIWTLEKAGVPYQIRLDQAMANALPIPAAGEPVWEAVLRTPENELHLREGETVTWEGTRMRFRRIPTPPLVRQTYSVLSPADGSAKPWTFTLEPGETRRVGEWRVTQRSEHTDAPNSALLHATRTLGDTPRLVGAGIFVVGLFGLTIFRFRGKRDVSEWVSVEPEAEPTEPARPDPPGN